MDCSHSSIARRSNASSLLDLPPEILCQILAHYFARHRGRRYSDHLIRAPVYYVCRDLRTATIPFVYRAPRIDHPYQACKFLTLVDEVPELRPWVKQLVLPRLDLEREAQVWQWQLVAPALHRVPACGLRHLTGLRELTIYDPQWIDLLRDIAGEPNVLPSLQICRIRMSKPEDAIGREWTQRISLSFLCALMSILGLQKLHLNGIHIVEDSHGDGNEEIQPLAPLPPLQSLVIYNCVIPPQAAKTLKLIRAVRSFKMKEIHSSLDASCSETIPSDFVSGPDLEKFRLRVGSPQAGSSPPQDRYVPLHEYKSLKTLQISALALGGGLEIDEGSLGPNHDPRSNLLDLKTIFPRSLECLVLEVVRSRVRLPLLFEFLTELVTYKSDIVPFLRHIELHLFPMELTEFSSPESQKLRSACAYAEVEYSDSINAVVNIYVPSYRCAREAICCRGRDTEHRAFESTWALLMTSIEDGFERERYENRWLAHVMGVEEAAVKRLEPTWPFLWPYGPLGDFELLLNLAVGMMERG